MRNILRTIFVSLLAIIGFTPFFVFAGTQHNLAGYAWSTGAGWISFNCTNDYTCDSYEAGVGTHGTTPNRFDQTGDWKIDLSDLMTANEAYNNNQITATEMDLVTTLYNYRVGTVRTGDYHSVIDGANYGVTMNSSGTLTGYAWSPVVGWIQFGGLSGFPTGSGTTAANAAVSGSSVTGWAKAVSADGNGWDGWISLSGSYDTGSYGVLYTGSVFTGYAWGGSIVGWVQFDVDAQNPGLCATDCGVRYFVPPPPPGFTLGTSDTVRVQALKSGSADSEQRVIYIETVSGFADPVTLTVSGPTPPASTTYQYSLDEGTTFSASPSRILTSPYATGAGFKVRIIRVSGAPDFDESIPVAQRTVTVTGTSGSLNATKEIIISPVIFNPIFREL